MTDTTTVGAVWTPLTERERAGNDSATIDEHYASRFPTNRNTNGAPLSAHAGGAVAAGHAFGRGLGFSGNPREKRQTHG
ncbi:MAG: hypothetical protein JO063_06100 [Pseudonocardiales bacterium]|nr:hypothetical protein [Pseudonocardiales bacterium]